MRSPTTLPHDVELAARQRPVRLLVVEDDQFDRMALERHVLRQRLPYEVVTAESGADAMQKLRARSFDIVLLDYMLGDMTGLELMPELRGTPAIIIAGLGNEEIAANAIRQGAYDYLVKDTQRAYLNLLPVVIRKALERKQIEDALRESQRRMSALLESVGGMAFRCSPAQQRRLETVSSGCRELTGYSVTELLDASSPSLAELIAPEDRERVAAAVEEALRTVQALDCVYRIHPRSGGLKWVRERSVAVRSEAGLPVAMEGYLADITPQVQVEDQVRHAKAQFEEAIRAKDHFMNLIVHDLRAPLSTCTLSVQQLRQELREFAEAHGIPDGTERRQRFADLFDGMTDRAADMLRMIDQLLLSSRIRSGRLVPALRPVGETRIQAIVASLEPLARQKGLALTCELPERFRLLADPDLLAEVLQNLLTNAIKFTRTGGTIEVGALGSQEHGLYVRDTGVGIPSALIPTLFQHDVRLSTSGTAGEKGSGMGLSICHAIVTAHGGSLGVRSAPGEGSEFHVCLPRSAPLLLAVAVRREDERMARVAVESLDGELTAVAASDEALDLAARRMPQAVLLDGDSPSAARTLIALRSDAVLRGVPVIWIGSATPPPGQIPDERLDWPLLDSALRQALHIPFGG